MHSIVWSCLIDWYIVLQKFAEVPLKSISSSGKSLLTLTAKLRRVEPVVFCACAHCPPNLNASSQVQTDLLSGGCKVRLPPLRPPPTIPGTLLHLLVASLAGPLRAQVFSESPLGGSTPLILINRRGTGLWVTGCNYYHFLVSCLAVFNGATCNLTFLPLLFTFVVVSCKSRTAAVCLFIHLQRSWWPLRNDSSYWSNTLPVIFNYKSNKFISFRFV